MLALSSTYLLVQVASFPVALSLPSIARDFQIDVETAAWILVAELLTLGATVYLAAKLGDKYGHNRIFFMGIVVTSIGAVAAGFAMDFTQLLIFRGIQGIGAALVTGNANAILAGTFVGVGAGTGLRGAHNRRSRRHLHRPHNLCHLPRVHRLARYFLLLHPAWYYCNMVGVAVVEAGGEA